MTEERELKRAPNRDAVGWPDDEYSADLGHDREAVDAGDTTAVTRPLGHHEGSAARERLGKAAEDLTVLMTGTRLQQGSTYLDLERLEDGPFVAMAQQHVEEGQLIVPKKEVDYETWNSLTGEGDRSR